MKNLTIVAATFMLAIGTGYVVAQSNPPAARPPSTNPTSPPVADAPPTSTMQPIGRQSMRPTTPPDFSALDTNGVGYVTQEQVGYDTWLRTHFASCDADHDGQVTRSEYDACAKSP